MDFFERQDKARRSTRWLTAYFVAGVGCLVLAVYAAVALLFTGASQFLELRGGQAALALWKPQLFGAVALCTLAVITLGSIFKTLELSQGGSAVATALGGRPVNPTTTDPDERKLLNVVEEMAIASGIPVPQVYVLPQENGINAFAAGHSTSDAVVAVTEGGLRLLSRDELQGVIGHEFSHILNGDMRLNLRLMGLLFGILCLAVIGRVLLEMRSRNSRDRNPLPLLGLALVVIGWVGVFFGRLIQAAVSRQREFLADASAVQFTRNPAGLAGALKKIGGLSCGSKLQAAHAEEASHMFFGNGMGESLFQLWETHPPLVERIRALDPAFDGVFPAIDVVLEEEAGRRLSEPAQAEPVSLPFSGQNRARLVVGGMNTPPPVIASALLASAARPTTAHLRYAEELRVVIPPMLQTAAREPLGATTLVYGLLLSESDPVRNQQLQDLAGSTSASTVQETLRILPQLETLAGRSKLPLVDLALPGLRQMSPRQFQEFRRAVQQLVESDGEIDLFEYVLQKIILRHLEPQFTGARKPVIQYYSLKALAGDGAVLLSALAHLGQQEPEQVRFAFEQGAQSLSYTAQTQFSLVDSAQCELSMVDTALERFSQAVPQIKKNILNAAAQVVAADGVIQEMEAELLRAIADALDCPLPPFINEPGPKPTVERESPSQVQSAV